MIIKSNVPHNVSFHKVPGAEVPGVELPNYMTVPAGAMLELDDAVWLGAYAGSKAVRSSIASKALTIVVDAESPLSEEEIAARIESQAGVSVDVESKEKSELQELASALDVDLHVEPEADEVSESEEDSDESAEEES